MGKCTSMNWTMYMLFVSTVKQTLLESSDDTPYIQSHNINSLTHRVNKLFNDKLCSVLCSSQHNEEWSSRGVTAFTTTCVWWPGVLCSHCSAGQTSIYKGIVLHRRTLTITHESKTTLINQTFDLIYIAFLFMFIGNVYSGGAQWRIHL